MTSTNKLTGTQKALLALTVLTGGAKLEALKARQDNKQSPSRKVGPLHDHEATLSALATDPIMALLAAVNPAAALRDLQGRGAKGSYRPTTTRGKVGNVPARGKHAAGQANNARELTKAQRPAVSSLTVYATTPIETWWKYRDIVGWIRFPVQTPTVDLPAHSARQLIAIVGTKDLMLERNNKRSTTVTGSAVSIQSANTRRSMQNYTLRTNADDPNIGATLWANVLGVDPIEYADNWALVVRERVTTIQSRMASLGGNGSLGLDVHRCRKPWIPWTPESPSGCACTAKQLTLFDVSKVLPIWPATGGEAHSVGGRYGRLWSYKTSPETSSPRKGSEDWWRQLQLVKPQPVKPQPVKPEWVTAANRQGAPGSDAWWHVVNRARLMSAKVDALAPCPAAQALAARALAELLERPKTPKARRLAPSSRKVPSLPTYEYLVTRRHHQ